MELQATTRHVPSSLPANPVQGRTLSVLGRGFKSWYIPRVWQRWVQEPVEQGHGQLIGKFGVAGGKAARLSAVPAQAELALGLRSPGADKSYRKRGDLSLRLAWLVSARRGER